MKKVLFFLGRGSRIAALTLVATAGVTCLSAATITGAFGTTGTGVLVFQSGGVNYLDFCPTDPSSPATGSPSCLTSSSGNGVLTVVGGTGSFTAVNPSSAGTIKDLKDSAGGNANFSTLQVGVTSALNNFLFLAALPTFNFQATLFEPATGCGGNTLCLGGFILTQVGSNVSVSATIDGFVSDGLGGVAKFTDILTGQYTNTTTLAVATAAQTAGGIFSNTWSNTVSTSPIPEPATLAILGGGLLLLGSLRRRIRS